MFAPVKKALQYEDSYVFNREIPSGLRLLVEKEQIVERDSVIAQGHYFEEKIKIDVATELGINSLDIKKYIKFINGEEIKKGEVLARKKGTLLKKEKRIIAPFSGLINLEEVTQGYVKILGAARERILYAGIEGTVKSVLKNKHVAIFTDVLKVRSFEMWGNTVQGELFYLLNNKIEIGAQLRHGIVVTESVSDYDTLRKFATVGVKGVIVPSIDASFTQEITEKGLWGMSIVAMNKYGKSMMRDDIKEIFMANVGTICSIEAKEKVIVLTEAKKDTKLEEETALFDLLSIGQFVQVLDVDHWGEYGFVSALSGPYATIKLTTDEISFETHINNVLICHEKIFSPTKR